MKTCEAIISQLDKLRPNKFEVAQKLEWLSALDGQIHAEYIAQAPDYDGSPYIPHTSIDDEVLIDHPFDEFYITYLLAQMDFYQGETQLYNNEINKFQVSYNNFGATYSRQHQAKKMKFIY